MIMTRRSLTFLAALLLLGAATARAASPEHSLPGAEELEKALPKSAAELMGCGVSPVSPDQTEALAEVLKNASVKAVGILKSTAKEASVVLVAAILTSAATAVCSNGKTAEFIGYAGLLAVAAPSLTGITSAAGEAGEAMAELSGFSKLLLPCLAAASAATGAVSSSSAKYAVATFFFDILITAGERLILPGIYIYLAVSLGAAAFGGAAEPAARLVARLVKCALTVTAMAFTIFLTLSGLVSSAADASAVKITRTAMSTAVPIVGGMASDAADAVLSGAAIIRNAVGAFGVVSVTALCIVPFLKLGILSLLYKASAALAGTLAEKRISSFMDAVSSAYSMMLGLTGLAAIMLFLSIVSVARAVTGL